MNYAITYGDEKFVNSREIARKTLEPFMETTVYTEKELEVYRPRYPHILYPNARGGGFWLYKAIFLQKKLKAIKENDGLMWMDAGCELIANPQVLFDIAQENNGFCLFQQPHNNRKFIKRNCFTEMGCEDDEFFEGNQCDASVMVFTKTGKVERFLNDFLFYCSLPQLITDSPSNEPNFPEFIDHRHDQAILTLMCINSKIPRFRQPSQFGEEWTLEQTKIMNSHERKFSKWYGQLFNHTRLRY